MQVRVNKWLLMFTSTIVAMQNLGLAFMFGSFLISLLDTYNKDRARTTTIQSLFVGFTVGFGVVSGVLITKFGLHKVALASSILGPLGFLLSYFATSIEYLYISIGIIAGIGNSLGYISSLVAIGRVFSGPQRMICLAFQSSAIAIAGLGYPYLIDLLIFNYGLKGSFLILSAFQSNALTFSIVCMAHKDNLEELSEDSLGDKTVKQNRKSSTPGHTETAYQNVYTTIQDPNQNIEALDKPRLSSANKDNVTIQNGNISTQKGAHCDGISECFNKCLLTAKRLFSYNTFVIILFSTAFTVSSLNVYQGLFLDICIWKGFSYKQGLFLFVIYNIASAITRLVPGILKQKKGISLFIFPIISSLSGFIVGLLLNFGKGYYVLVIATCLVGISFGAIISSMTMIIVEVIPSKLVPVATGLQFTFNGILTSVIGPIYGGLRDITGSYSIVLLTISVIHGVAVIFNTIALLINRRQNKRKLTDVT